MSGHNLDHIKTVMKNFSDDEIAQVRDWANDKLQGHTDSTLGSADASADDEKKKFIAQHGADPNAQTTAQNVPQPVSDEVKDLQNEKAREEHDAKGHAADGSH